MIAFLQDTVIQDTITKVVKETPIIDLETFIDFNLTNPIDIPLGSFYHDL